MYLSTLKPAAGEGLEASPIDEGSFVATVLPKYNRLAKMRRPPAKRIICCFFTKIN
jgi:hypothetical protein